MNNFQQLQQETEAQNPAPADLRENVLDSMRMLQFFGAALDLYLPRVLETAVLWLGGTPAQLEEGERSMFFDNLRGTSEGDESQAPDDIGPGNVSE